MIKKSNHKPDLIGWLGYNRELDFSRLQGLGHLLGCLLFLLALASALLFVTVLCHFIRALLHQPPYQSDISGEAIRNIGLVLAAILGAPFVVWRTLVAAKQASIAEQALFNDKINSAAQSLTSRREVTRTISQEGRETVLKEWEDDLVSRIGAVDRLEGLVEENEEIAPRIVRLLATYIRSNFPCENLEPTENLEKRKTPRMDLQKAVDAIGRTLESAQKVDPSHWRLDLTACNFDGVNFSNGYFRAVDFSRSRFEAAIFRQANLEGCLLDHSLLNYCDCLHTNLRGAKLNRIIYNVKVGGWSTGLEFADLTGVSFIAADISALDYLGTPEEISKTFGTKDTRISDKLRDYMLSDDEHQSAHILLLASGSRTKEEQAKIEALKGTGFQHWSPYDSTDGFTGHLLQRFYQDLGMNHWPYWG